MFFLITIFLTALVSALFGLLPGKLQRRSVIKQDIVWAVGLWLATWLFAVFAYHRPGLTIGFNNAVLAEASMSYLCIGVTPPDASLGYMLSESQGMFMSAPWYALGTGLTLVWMVFGVGLIGEGLQRRGGGEV